MHCRYMFEDLLHMSLQLVHEARPNGVELDRRMPGEGQCRVVSHKDGWHHLAHYRRNCRKGN